MIKKIKLRKDKLRNEFTHYPWKISKRIVNFKISSKDNYVEKRAVLNVDNEYAK